MLTIKKLLERINLNIPLGSLATKVAGAYNLGSVVSFEPLLVGYEEVNCLLKTTVGKYIVKIFSKDKDRKTINSNVSAILGYSKGNIPVPKLYQYSSDNYLYEIDESGSYLVVMDYFDGDRFTEIIPTMEDKKNITRILSDIHKLEFTTSANYDIWLTINLAKEFEDKNKYLSKESLKLVELVVSDFRTIKYEELTKSIVHYDLHRENVLKDANGTYCILDLASTDYNYKVLDLATFIALFCTEFKKSLADNIAIYKQIISKYLQSGSLNQYELKVLLILIKATFASNLLISEYLQKSDKDENPEQTTYYKSMADSGLLMFGNVYAL